MNVSYAWLRAIAPGIVDTPEALAQRLALRGTPVETLTALAEGIEGVVVARVESVAPHPNADRLRVCSVDDGSGAPLRVVCGAPNVQAGGVYPFARVGTTLPGDLTIQKAKIRGEVSEGMLCSARELGLGHDHGGLLELPTDLAPGSGFVDALSLRDHRLDVEVTANRGDLLSHVGIAREIAPGGESAVSLPPIPGAPTPALERVTGKKRAKTGSVSVRIDAPDLCSRYLAAVIRGVTVGPSPGWLQARLRAAGARPINNVVDATNYVMLELGQPLHAFDLAELAGSGIVVRRPTGGDTPFRTLDGIDRTLGPEMLLICDAKRPVAIAGVMGGLDSEVTDGTRDVLLECALFDPKSIRATRRALGLSTDASYRFERGVDPEGMERALARAVEIILATAGGAVEEQVADCCPRRFTRTRLPLRPARVRQVLGVEFSPADLAGLLGPLGFEVEGKGKTLRVGVPGFRSYDVTREIDLVEEVARTYGFDAFPAALSAFRPGTVPDHPLFGLEDRLRDQLVARGLFEAHTPAFVGEAQGEVRLRNPLSAEEAYLRRTVLPSLLRRVEHNWARGTRDVRLFELATSFSRSGGEYPVHEEPRIAAVVTGRRAPGHFSEGGEAFGVWDLKAILEDVALTAWPGSSVEAGVEAGQGFEPELGFTVRAAGSVVGRGGRVAGDRLDAPPWAEPVWGIELRLPDEPTALPTPRFRGLPAFPSVERDLALIVPDRVTAAEVEGAIRGRGGDLLTEVAVFDLYRGKGVPDGHRSLAFRLRFSSPDRTLTDAEVDRAVTPVVAHLKEALGVERRG